MPPQSFTITSDHNRKWLTLPGDPCYRHAQSLFSEGYELTVLPTLVIINGDAGDGPLPEERPSSLPPLLFLRMLDCLETIRRK